MAPKDYKPPALRQLRVIEMSAGLAQKFASITDLQLLWQV